MPIRLPVGALVSCLIAAGQTAAPKPKDHVIGATTQEVMLDVVVRDKKGRMVKNLRADEIEVTDDGIVRKLRSFRATGSGDLDVEAALTPAARHVMPSQSALARALNPAHDPRLVTLVFDQLLPEQRAFAKQAALELLNSHGPDQLFAVFRIDATLRLIESYTLDVERARVAILRATDPSFFLNIDERDRIARNQTTQALSEQLMGLKEASSAAHQLATTDQRVAQMTLNMLQFADTGTQKEQSRAQLVSLWALVKEQKQLPGRKTVVYFTGGMNVPPEYNERFRAIVADANLANVTVYAINAGGIASYRSNDSGNALLGAAAASSRSNMLDRTGFVSVDQAQVFDRAEDSVHANIHNALEMLTRDTGGFYSSDSNDFHGPLKRIAEEVDFHYELTYSPEIEKYDGHLRKIAVKVSRPDVRVQTRSGYYALPAVEGQDLQPYEGPMLSALSMHHGPSALPFRAEAKVFGTKTSLVVDVPIEHVALASDDTDGSFRMHMSVLGLFKDSDGVIVQKVTRDVPAKGKLENLQATRTGHFIFTQHVDLPPGRYTLEAAVFDRESLKIGTKKQVVIVPTSRGLSLSSLSLVRKVGPAEASDRESPYEFAGTKVTPELNSTIKGGPGGSLGVYLVVYAAQREHPATLTIDFLQDGKLVARSEPELPAATGDGRIPVLAHLPIHTLKPGTYELLAKVFQSGRGAEERILIEIE